jgi:hypothetical protein
MIYPKEFIDKCKTAYPDKPHLHDMLNSGSQLVGRALSELETNSISTAIVLAATSLEELQNLAKIKNARCALYREWMAMYREQILNR